jgi:nickel transport protein
VTVAYDGDPRGVTGADGRINLRIRHRGTQVITASIDETSPDGSKVVRSTALLFDLP